MACENGGREALVTGSTLVLMPRMSSTFTAESIEKASPSAKMPQHFPAQPQSNGPALSGQRCLDCELHTLKVALYELSSTHIVDSTDGCFMLDRTYRERKTRAVAKQLCATGPSLALNVVRLSNVQEKVFGSRLCGLHRGGVRKCLRP